MSSPRHFVEVAERISGDRKKVVWKYKVPAVAGPQAVRMPTDAFLVHTEFAVDDENEYMNAFYLWYEVRDPNDKYIGEVDHAFQIFGTGFLIPTYAKHVCTGVVWGEDHRNRRTLPKLVWHLYEYPVGSRVVEISDGRD